MTLISWLPAVSTTGLFAIALWLGRKLLITRLTKSVEHEFNEKLETLKAEFRRGEERLRADIRAKEAEISSLRSGAMSALASRQVAIDKRRLEAVDQLWAATVSLGPARFISSLMAVIKFDEAAKQAEHDPRFRQLFELFGKGIDLNSMGGADAQRARPFVSPIAWATYTALLSITIFAVMRWQILKNGIGKVEIFDLNAINKLLKTALPHQTKYIDQYGPTGYHYLLEELESKLLHELQQVLIGSDTDKANLEQAAEIVKQSHELLKQVDARVYSGQSAAPPA